TATAGSDSTNEDTTKALTLAGSAVDGDSLVFRGATLPAHGRLFDGNSTLPADLLAVGQLTTGASVTYKPAANYNGADSFTFKANDGTLDSVLAATFSLTVNPVNDAPTATADVASRSTQYSDPIDKVTITATDDVDSAAGAVSA